MSFPPEQSNPPNMEYNDAFTIGENDGFVGTGAMDSGGVAPSPTTTNTTTNTTNTTTTENNDPSNQTTFYEKLLFCFSVNTYTKFFDVDTIDIWDRMVASVTKFGVDGGFQAVLERNGSGPDLYGPFWLSTTLVFLVAVSSNLSMYLHSDSSSDFEYDINHVGRAMGVIYSFVFVLPTILYFTLNFLSISVQLADLICLYGYSLVPYLPAAFLCVIPVDILMWSLLLTATALSLILVLKNLVGTIMKIDDSESSISFGRKKTGPVFGTLMGCHIIFLLVLKFRFYHHHHQQSHPQQEQQHQDDEPASDAVTTDDNLQ